MNIHIFNRNAELHASQVTATLYIKTKPVCCPLLTASKSIQLKSMRFAALGREQASNRGKRNSQQPMRHLFALTKKTGVLLCIIYQVLFLVKAYTVYLI